MTITYRTTGDWGSGKGSDLTAAEVDTNFYSINTKINTVENNPPIPDVIESISVSNNEMTIHLAESNFGPFKLPNVSFVYKGNWLPNTTYDIGNIVFVKFTDAATPNLSGIYYINELHTSDATFNPSKIAYGKKVYNQFSTLPQINKLKTPTYPSSIDAFTLLNYNKDIYLTLEPLNVASSSGIDDAISNDKIINLSNINRIYFKNLGGVTEYTQNDANKYAVLDNNGTTVEYGVPSFEDIFYSPGPFSGNENKVVKVINFGQYDYPTLEYKELSSLDLADNYSTYSGLQNSYVKINANETALEYVPQFGTAFSNLTDTSLYTNYPNAFLGVNSTGDSIEYKTLSVPFINLTDAPQNYTNAASKYVSVNANGDGLEFLDGISGNPKSTLTYLATQTPSGQQYAEFLNIPNTARRIFILFHNLGLSASTETLLQLGNSGGYVTTGYTYYYSYLRTSLNGSAAPHTTGFGISGSGTRPFTCSGYSVLNLASNATRIWTYSGVYNLIQSTNYYTIHTGGSKTLGANVDVTKIKISSANGSDTFASGTTISIAYE